MKQFYVTNHFVDLLACHNVVSVDGFYSDCMYDVCECNRNLRECLCPTLATYADLCAKAGIDVLWREHVTACGKDTLFIKQVHEQRVYK